MTVFEDPRMSTKSRPGLSWIASFFSQTGTNNSMRMMLTIESWRLARNAINLSQFQKSSCALKSISLLQFYAGERKQRISTAVLRSEAAFAGSPKLDSWNTRQALLSQGACASKAEILTEFKTWIADLQHERLANTILVSRQLSLSIAPCLQFHFEQLTTTKPESLQPAFVWYRRSLRRVEIGSCLKADICLQWLTCTTIRRTKC